MKKGILALALLLFCAALPLVSASNAEDSGSKTTAERKAKREANQAQAIGLMKAALAEQSFCFYPDSYTLPYQNPVELFTSSTQYYLSFYPNDLDIILPFELQNEQKLVFDSQLTPYENYDVKTTSKPMQYIITAQLKNVSSNSFNAPLDSQAINLSIHISVNISTGTAYMTITPDFSAAVVYEGTIRPH
ncbi:MAG: hypothetical protein R3Y49_08115 [Rikenellaceae bacterium]